MQQFIRHIKPISLSPLLPLTAVILVIYLLTRLLPVISSDPLSQLRMMSFTAGLCLLLGIFTITNLLPATNPFRMILTSNYGVLLIAFLLPFFLLLLPDLSLSITLQSRWHPDSLSSWWWLYQFYYLGLALLFSEMSRESTIDLRTSFFSRVFLGSFAGLGLWLCISFLQPALRSFLPTDLFTTNPLPMGAHWLFYLAVIVISPWSSELLFRSRLIAQWAPKMGFTRACLLSAAIYAAFQVRPLLWLPAFLIGIGLAVLARNSKSIIPSIVAHAVFNILVLLLQQSWVL